ncbi:MAG TPA: PASTA domain-containing protein [Mycobacteriales bacterium]|nr:PASTA domain-containing protein [Mycobacteriales bacterium]
MAKPGGQWREGRRAWERLKDWLHDDGLASIRRESDGGRQALDALVDIGAIRRVLDQAELAAVRAARQHGKSWAEVATHLGVTRQSAWERWRDLDDAPGEAPTTERDVVLQVESAALANLAEQRARAARRRSTVTVPNLVGLPWEEAQLKLTGMGLVTLAADPDGPPQGVTAASSVVTDQSPEAGAKVQPGSAVRLWIGRGGGSAGVREPRRPSPAPKPAREMRPEPADEAAG